MNRYIRMHGWMNGWRGECVKGWMNKCKNETLAERSERMNVEIL